MWILQALCSPCKVPTCGADIHLHVHVLHVHNTFWIFSVLFTTACSADIDATCMRIVLILHVHVFADSSPM